MKIQEYKACLNRILDRNFFLRKQIHALSVASSLYTTILYPTGEEHKCIHDLTCLWRDYEFKLKKSIFFLEHYCDGLLKELDFYSDKLKEHDDIYVNSTINLEEAIFHFDALILSISTLIDYETRDYLATQLNKSKISNIYPSKTEIGLYWQLNILRNRIIHHTGGRFINKEQCERFLDFSSMVPVIRIRDKNVSLTCTQLDIYQEVFKENFLKIVQTGQNVFDYLFCERKGKGRNRKYPLMIFPNENIYFDHTTAGVKVVCQIQDFIYKFNQVFFEEFCCKSNKKETFLNLSTEIFYKKDSYKYQIKDVFEESKWIDETLNL